MLDAEDGFSNFHGTLQVGAGLGDTAGRQKLRGNGDPRRGDLGMEARKVGQEELESFDRSLDRLVSLPASAPQGGFEGQIPRQEPPRLSVRRGMCVSRPPKASPISGKL